MGHLEWLHRGSIEGPCENLTLFGVHMCMWVMNITQTLLFLVISSLSRKMQGNKRQIQANLAPESRREVFRRTNFRGEVPGDSRK